MQQLQRLSVAGQRPRASKRRRARDAPVRRPTRSAPADFSRPAPGPCGSATGSSCRRPASISSSSNDPWSSRRSQRTGWNQTKAAALLGLNRDQIRYRIEKFQLEKESRRAIAARLLPRPWGIIPGRRAASALPAKIRQNLTRNRRRPWHVRCPFAGGPWLPKNAFEAVLDRVRPFLQADGGDIELVAVEGNSARFA